MKKKIGEKIRQARLYKKYSQENVAMDLGISISAYSNIERGKTDLTITRLYEISKVFGISVEELLFGPSGQDAKDHNLVKNEYPPFFNAHELRELKEEIKTIKKDVAILKRSGRRKA